MADTEDKSEKSIQANNNSVAVGKIEIEGSVGGNITIGNTHIHNYSQVDQEKAALSNETISVKWYEPETVLIPEGTFWMGGNAGDGIPDYETPQHEVSLPTYRIGKFPITNQQFEEFTRAAGRVVPVEMGWDGQNVPVGMDDFPAAGISWYEAMAYCEWLGETTGRNYSLPNEAQWEKACRAGDRFLYPWGAGFEEGRSNHGGAAHAAVNAFPAQNRYGLFDLVGNIYQWTCSLWGEKRTKPDPKFAYPWKDDRRNDPGASRQVRRVIRGSSMKDDISKLRCSLRSGQFPQDVGGPDARHGFRIVMTI